jgi:hypothetical protein
MPLASAIRAMKAMSRAPTVTAILAVGCPPARRHTDGLLRCAVRPHDLGDEQRGRGVHDTRGEQVGERGAEQGVADQGRAGDGRETGGHHREQLAAPQPREVR